MLAQPRKAVLILRVSDPKQEKEGLSLDSQEQSLVEYSRQQGLQVERKFRFQETADLKRRVKFHEMIRFVRGRKDIPAIVGYRVDRLTRNYHDHVLLDELRLNHGKELHFVHDRLIIEPHTVGRNIAEWDTKVFLAKSHINRLKEDATATIAYKLSLGELPGRAPFGYRNVKRENRSWVELQESQASIVYRAFQLYGSGNYSMDQVRSIIRDELKFSMPKGNLDRMLKTRFYYGEMSVKGCRYPHVYKPIITYRMFQRVEQVKAGFRKKSFKYAGLPFTYRGLIVCGDCGCRISPELKRKPTKTYCYYHCTQYNGKHGAEYVTEAELDKQFEEILSRLHIPDDIASHIVDQAQSSGSVRETTKKLQIGRLEAERTKLRDRLEMLYEDRLDRVISVADYSARKEAAQALISALDRELADIEANPKSRCLTIIRLVQLCRLASRAFAKAGVEEKRWILRTVLSNCQLKGKRLLWELKKPFDTVLSCSDRHVWGQLIDTFGNGDFEIDIDEEELSQGLIKLGGKFD